MPILEGFQPVGAGPAQSDQQSGGVLQGFQPVDAGDDDDHPRQSPFRRVADLGVDVLKGVSGLGQALKGLGSEASGNTSSQAMEDYRQMLAQHGMPLPQDLNGAQQQADLSRDYSAARQQAEQQVEQAHGFGQTAGAMLRNPSTLAGRALQMAPGLAVGMAAGPAAPLVFGAQSAGEAGQNVLDQDPNNTKGMYEAAGVAGTVSAATVGLGSRFLTPAATALGTRFAGDFLGRATANAVDQGVQGAAMNAGSTAGENVGEGKPWSQGVGSSALGGFVGGALAGVGMGMFHGQRSALPGANERTPTADPVEEALDPSQGQQGDLFPINPYNVGGHVDALNAGHDTALDAGPQGDLYDTQPSNGVPVIRPGQGLPVQDMIDRNLGIGRPPATTEQDVQAALGEETPFTLHEPQTQVEQGPMTQGNLFDIREQPQAQAAAQQAQSAQAREGLLQSLFAKVGPRADLVHPALGEVVVGAHAFDGQEHGTTPDYNRYVDKLLTKEAQKSPVQHDAEQLLSDAWREDRVAAPDQRSTEPGPYPAMSDIDKLVRLTGVNEAPTLAQAAAKIDMAINRLANSKAQTSLDKVQILTAWRNKILHGDVNGQDRSGTEGVNASGAQDSNAQPGGTQSVGPENRGAGSAQDSSAPGPQGPAAAEGSSPAESAQAAEVAQLQGQQPADVQPGSAQAGQEQPVTPPVQKTGGFIQLKRRGGNGQQQQAAAGDVAGRPAGVGPVPVRPAGELRQPLDEQAGAARDSSVRGAGAADSSPAGDAAVPGGGHAAGGTEAQEVTDALAQAQKNNTFAGQAPGAGRTVGRTQPKGTPVGKLFSNFADNVKDTLGGKTAVQKQAEFRAQMFDRANADPKQFTTDPVLTHTEDLGNGLTARVDAAKAGNTRVQILDGDNVVGAAHIKRGMLDSIAVTEDARGRGIGADLLRYLDRNNIANIHEVPDRSPGFVKIQKQVLSEPAPAAPQAPAVKPAPATTADSAQKNEARDRLWREALAGTKNAERDFNILQDHFVNDMSHRELGDKYGLDHSRITQIVGEKSLGPKVVAAANRLGYTPEDIMQLMHEEPADVPTGETAYDENEHAAKAEDATPASADEMRVEGNELHGDEDRGVTQSMGVVKSAGGSQSKWKDTGDLTDQWLKAQKKLAAIEAPAGKNPGAGNASENGGREAWDAHGATSADNVAYDDLPKALRNDWDALVANGDGSRVDRDKWLKARTKVAELEAQAKQNPDAWKTSEDRGREAWEAHEATVPSNVAYDDLPESLRSDWDEFVGNGNGTLADKAQIVNRLDSNDYPDAYQSRSAEFRGVEARYGNVSTVTANLRHLGIPHAVDSVDHWSVSRLPDGVGGEITLNRDGTVKITLNASVLQHGSPALVQHAITHELWHGIDNALHGGVYSVQPEMRLEEFADDWAPEGSVARELHDLWSNDPTDGAFEQYFDYPLNRGQHPDLDRQDAQAELFAQLGSMYTDPRGRAILERYAPESSAFMREVTNDVQQSPEALLARSGDGAEQRATGFENRAAGEPAAVRLREGGSGDAATADAAGSPERSLQSRGPDYDHDSVDERRPRAERLISALPEGLASPVQRTYDTLAHAAKRGTQALTFGHDLADWASSRLGMEAPREYMDLHGEQDAYRRTLDNQLGEIGQKASALSLPQRDMASTFLTETTMSQKWGYDPAWKSGVTVDPATKARFNALPASVQEVIKAVNEHGAAQRSQLRAAEEEVRKMMGADAPRVAGAEMPGPYLPLRRHGDYVVEAKSATYKAAEAAEDTPRMDTLRKDPDHYVYTQTRTMGEARALAKELEAKYGAGNAQPMAKDVYFKDSHGASWRQLEQWRAKMRDYFDTGTPQGKEYAAAMDRALTDMYLQSIADTSARAGELKRKNIPGVIAKQGLESFFQNGLRHNQLVSTMLHGAKIADAMKGMADEAKQGGAQRPARTDIVNEFQKRAIAQANNRPSRVMDNLLMFNTAWRLLTSPAHYLQYIAQPVTMAHPILGARHGYGAAWKEMIGAAQDTAKLGKGGNALKLDVSKHVSRVGDERGMLTTLQRQGVLDAGHESEYGKPEVFSSNQLTRAGATAMNKVTMVARGLEGYNRTLSALAAYRLAHADSLNRGGDADAAHAAGTKFARDVVRQAYGDYSAANTPRALMPGNAPGLPVRLMAQFRKFNIIHTSIVARLAHQAFTGASPEERVVGGKALGYMALHYGVLAGAMGIPGAQLLAYAIQKIFSDSDVPEDPESYFRRVIGDKFLADIILHGAPAALGIDLTNRIGAGDILNPLGRANVNGGKTAADDYKSYMLAALGPMLGTTLPNVLTGAGRIMQGDYYHGLEQMVPSGIRDGMKAYGLAADGLTNSRNDTIIKPEDISAFDVALQAAGVTPMKIEDSYRRAAEFHNAQTFFQQHSQQMVNQYAKAYRDGDSATLRDLQGQWKTMQEQMRSNGLKPSPFSTLLRAPMNQGRRENSIVGGVETGRSRGAYIQQQGEQ
ncbi:PLxRFG domain-containing protein [Paraburkholderia sp. BL10I2N1]|uniref:PLxRFG domain-containing protein n=1 Tax=Paraburkholderia sp. BL10I2N1 TaxID=1938796 RepID=UPI00106108E0|nr:PLxRFG domain-containing protein [Paraburkholderia sp. BL10I2N1]TDN70393.1 hypothetical protein B0G77_3866 [Paraburkholderia sp. BL10I2N1]